MIPLELLTCPCCGASLALEITSPARAGLDVFGVLSAPCGSHHPVLDGIPIFTTEAHHFDDSGRDEGVAAMATSEVIRRLRAGEDDGLLADVLATPWCPWPLNRVAQVRGILTDGRIGGLNRRLRAARVRQRIRAAQPETAEEWLARFHVHGPLGRDSYSYFMYRFAQPRHLAALALLATLRDDERPVIDVACGYGHLTHFLTAGRRRGGAIGVDVNFSQIWVAKRLVAPDAHYVCADANRPLPFADGVAAAATCSDAFHYLADPAARLADFARCTRDGPILLPRFGNRLVEPNEGHEHSPSGWAAILSDVGPWRMRAEDDLLTTYLEDRGAQLAAEQLPTELDAHKWLYAVIDPTGSLLVDHPPPRPRPHLAGRLSVNPIYQLRRTRHRVGTLRFTWPSAWYAVENAAMSRYHAGEAAIDDTILNRRSSDTDHPAVLAAMRQFVLIGLPDRYTTTSRRRPAVRARQVLGTLKGRVAGRGPDR